MIKKSKDAVSLIAIAGGYKITDVSQKIHDGFKANEMSSYIDGLASGPYHRVEAGHDILFNAKSIYEKFGLKGLTKDYPMELSKDALSKHGIPLPGVEGLVNKGIISHKAGTEWLSVNIGEVFTGGLATYHTYKLYKKSKKGKFNKKDVIWISIGIGMKLVAGTITKSPVLIISGLVDGHILLKNNAEVKKIIKGFLKKTVPPVIVAIATGVGTASVTTGAIGVFGVASTGTAISSLSGVAAKNAILAWIGGGSLATGGLGVLGGTIILTGGSALIGVGAGYLVYKVFKKKKKSDNSTLLTRKKLKYE